MQETKFKVGDKVKVISIPGVDINNHPDMKDKIYTVRDTWGKEIYINDSFGFVFHASNLESVSKSLTLKGHLWLIVNKESGKVVEGYETRKEARENLNSNYDFRKNFKVVKYEFK